MREIINHLILTKDKLEVILNQILTDSKGCLFTYLNQHCFNVAYKNENYRELLRNFVVFQEGIGMYLFLKFLNYKIDRIDATEINSIILDLLKKTNQEFIFIGGDFNQKKFIEDCRIKSLQIENYHHGYFENIEAIKNVLVYSESNFVLLGMGVPRQEFVAYELSKSFPDKKFVCVGNLINFYLGYQKRSPIIIRKLQLEWLFRLIQSPKRYFFRYVIGIPLFFFRIFFIILKR